MFVTIINDCKDANAVGRQGTRAGVLFGVPITMVGVESDLAAAGNLVDVLDAGLGEEGVVLVNVAPRHGEAKKHENGTPFGFFWYKKTLVVASVDGATVALADRLGLVNGFQVTDMKEVLHWAAKENLLSEEDRDRVTATQFRSFEYVPRLAYWVWRKHMVPAKPYHFSHAHTAHRVWQIDNFGNCKTTALPEDIDFLPGKTILANIGPVRCYDRLKDVPNHETALIVGSSGIGERRFVEYVIQGGNAARDARLKEGDAIFK